MKEVFAEIERRIIMEFYKILFSNNEQGVFELNTNIFQKEDGTHCDCETVNIGDKIFYKNGFKEVTKIIKQEQ